MTARDGRAPLDRSARARWETAATRLLEQLDVIAPAPARRQARALVEAQRAVNTARAELERLEGKRDAVIVRARGAGLGRPECATLAGLGVDRIGQITRTSTPAARPALVGADSPELPLGGGSDA